MARRSSDWNEGLANDLKNPRFAQEFFRASLEEGLPLQVVLAKVIRAYGVKEFASKVNLPCSNVIRAISPRHNPTLDTMNRLLKPFALEVSVAPAAKKRRVA